eukprot:scaffold139965_cov118-Phaeocystis_antarctica.AAC.2
MQDHKVFARHNKFGTFQVPKEFLNTHEKASAAVAPIKAVRQARWACMCSLLDTLRGPHCQTLYCAVLSDSYTYPSAPREFLYIGTPTPVRRLHAPLMS